LIGLLTAPNASLVKGRWVALKRRLGGIPHAATPLFCKVFGEFVLPARIPPDRLLGDPTPVDKGGFGCSKLFGKFLFDLMLRAHTVRLNEFYWGVSSGLINS
ncbi:MAG: hypothetical protein IJA48_02640, partial [Oscillospiraceae bacterium]|nr:hypothetical protein [Oscillospiraceae bacterium]